MSTDGDLYVAWTEVTATTGPDTRILMRHFDGSDWYPPLGPTSEPYEVTAPFNGFYFGAPPAGIGSERSVPSIAVDQSGGPYHGWIYVVYADYGAPFEQPPVPSRLKFTRSCDKGVNWSTPCAISPDADVGHEESAQVYPRFAVDGRGNIGVSWYDTRFNGSAPGQNVMYDLFFAYSSNGGEDWIEQRVTPAADDELPQFQVVDGTARDYSAMTSDPRSGESRFYILAMGTPRDEDPPDQDIYSYEVKLRVAGDWNGDYDIDLGDWVWFDRCFTGMNTIPMDECVVFDFDDDGHVSLADGAQFQDDFTGNLCTCADLCQLDSECLGGAPLGPGSTPMGTDGLPDGCEVAAPLLDIAPIEAVSSFAVTLRDYLGENPDAPDYDEVSQYVECIEAVLR